MYICTLFIVHWSLAMWKHLYVSEVTSIVCQYASTLSTCRQWFLWIAQWYHVTWIEKLILGRRIYLKGFSKECNQHWESSNVPYHTWKGWNAYPCMPVYMQPCFMEWAHINHTCVHVSTNMYTALVLTESLEMKELVASLLLWRTTSE